MIFLLMVFFELRHFICDFCLQGKYMLGKFADDFQDFVLPLLAHSAVNAAGTLAICLWFRPEMWWLFLVDLVSHFFIDRLKAGKKYLGRYHALSAGEMKENLEILNREKMLGGGPHVEGITRAIKSNGIFWLALGLDQMLHRLVYIFIIFMLMRS